jgi:hypothetical protein
MNMQADDHPRVAIAEVERERRQRAVNFARASIGLEGFALSRADEERARRFIDGEIDLPEFVEGSPIDSVAHDEPL